MPDYDDLRLKYNYGSLENPPYYVTAYGIAVKHGYQGTEEEWIHEIQESAHDSSIAAAESAEAAAGSADTAEAFGAGTRGGEPLDEDDPAYHNNAQYYSDHAEAYGAGTRGGEPVEDDDPAYHNNAQYFAGQAQATADGLDARLDAQDTAIATIRSQVASPYVIAATGAAMTDQTKAYVYVGDGTGDDAGLVNGAWYYYDADAEEWTQGGTSTDPTLSVAGAAADAKATGDVKDAVGDLMVVPYAVSIGSLVASGTINPTTGYNGTNSSKYTRTGYISVSRFALMVMDSNEYEFTAWSYTGSTVGTRVRSLTNQAYTTKAAFVFLPGGSNNIRIGFHRLDDAVLTTDTSDPTSDFSKIAAAIKFYQFTDTTLSVSGAAADAKVAGDKVAILDDIVGPSNNLIDSGNLLIADGWSESDGVYTGPVGALVDNFYSTHGGFPINYKFEPDTQYTVSLKAKINSSGLSGSNGIVLAIRTSDGNSVWQGLPRTTTDWATLNVTNPVGTTVTMITFSYNGTSYHDNSWSIKEFSMTKGTATEYVEYKPSAIDNKARGLLSTFDTTDRAPEILDLLHNDGYCYLGAGDYYISPFVMPDNTILSGKGNGTRIILLDDYDGCAISMKSGCKVENLCILGSDDPDYDESENTGYFPGSRNKDFVSEFENLWGNGTVSTTDSSDPDSGVRHIVLANSLAAGEYYIEFGSCESNALTDCYIAFSTSPTASISSDDIVQAITIHPGTNVGVYVSIPATVKSMRFCAGDSLANSNGYTATWSDISLYRIPARSGIGWVQQAGETLKSGTIINCSIARFSCAGIYAADTGTPIDRGLTVESTQVRYCNVGYYFRKNSEFNIVSGCLAWKCHYGVLNRGGNNNFCNSIFTGNYINARQDMDEGSNTGHGNITNCIMHHSNYNRKPVYHGLEIEDTGRIGVNGCKISDGIILKNTNGNIFNGCGFGDVDITVINGQCSLIVNSIFRSCVATRENNITAIINGCYLRNGTPVTWDE